MKKRLEEIKARLETDNIAVIERWDKVTGEHIVYSHDLEKMSADLTYLLALVERQAKALEYALDIFRSMGADGLYEAEIAELMKDKE